MGSERACSSSFSIAEAPRRQVGQVGESSRTSRTWPDASSNSLPNFPMFDSESNVSGGCPAGVREEPQIYQTIKSAAMIPTAHKTNLIFTTGMSHPAIRLAISCGKRMTRRTMTAASQNIAMLSGLRLWH
jgi:hypothetical protein